MWTAVAPSSPISDFKYQYDPTGNRTRVVEASGDRVTWSYDPTNQLTHEIRDGVNSYNVTHTWDRLGNRLVKDDSGALTTSTYDAANRLINALDSTGTTTFTFDATGNQTKQVSPSGQITTSVWDFENMNTATLLPSSDIVTLVYNGDQMRVEKETASSTRKLVYDGQNILLETDGSNLVQSVNTLEPLEYGNLIAQRQLQSGIWVPVTYQFDGLGSTDSLTDSAQVVTDTYTYFAFGKLKNSTGTTANEFQWVGQLLYVIDPETGKYKAGIRIVDPNRERFMSQDPQGQDPDPNEYRYVRNRPTQDTDPSGNGNLATGPGGALRWRIPAGKWWWSDDEINVYIASPFDAAGTSFYMRAILPSGDGDCAEVWFVVTRKDLDAFIAAQNPSTLDKWTTVDWYNWFKKNGTPDIRRVFPCGPQPPSTGADADLLGNFFEGGRAGDIPTQCFPKATVCEMHLIGEGVVAVGELIVLIQPTPGIRGSVPIARTRVPGVPAGVPRKPNRIYSARELMRRAQEPGPFHNFPECFNQEIFKGNRQVVSKDYILYTERGSINGRTGTFEIGVRPSASGRTEVIVHRFFRPDH